MNRPDLGAIFFRYVVQTFELVRHRCPRHRNPKMERAVFVGRAGARLVISFRGLLPIVRDAPSVGFNRIVLIARVLSRHDGAMRAEQERSRARAAYCGGQMGMFV